MLPEEAAQDNDEAGEVVTAPLSADQMQEYTGAYWCEELLAHYLFSVQDGILCYARFDEDPDVLASTGADKMRCARYGGIEFVFGRDNHGDLTGFTLNGDAVWGYEFRKI